MTAAHSAADVERLQAQDDGYRARLDRLTAETKDLAGRARRAGGPRRRPLEGVGGLPLLAVISLAVLAGAAGRLRDGLAGRAPGRRPATGAVLSPAPRGVDPA